VNGSEIDRCAEVDPVRKAPGFLKEADVVARDQLLAEEDVERVPAVERGEDRDVSGDRHRNPRLPGLEVDADDDPLIVVGLHRRRIEDPHRAGRG
jgi:hypothetical protein